MRSLVGTLINAAKTDKPGNSPVPYATRAATGANLLAVGGANDREAQANAMTVNGTLFAIAGGLALSVSRVEWHLYREAKSAKPEDREIVTEHAAWDVFNNPNPFMSRQELFETIEQHLGLTGEGWPLLVRDERADWPIEWWPLYPHRMLPVPDPDKYLLGYLYQSPDGARIPIQFRDVPLMRQPHPANFYGGLSAVRAVQTDLEATQAARMWNRTFFYNSAQPGGIIEVPRELTDDEFDNMRTHWQEQHQGVVNAHRVAILEHGKWVNRHYSMRDMEFTHLLQMSAEEIRRAFRYPVAMLGDAGDVNRATALAHKAIYMEDLIVPRLDRWRGMLNSKFLPQFGPLADGLVFDYVSPVPADAEELRADMEVRARVATIYIEAGWSKKVAAKVAGLPQELIDAADEEPATSPETPPAKSPTQRRRGGLTSRALPAGSGTWAATVAHLLNQDGEPDMEEIQRQWEAAREDLLNQWPDASQPLIDDLADQARTAAANDDSSALGELAVAAVILLALAALLGDKSQDVASDAAAAVTAEAADQGVTIDPPHNPGAVTVTAVATAVVGVIAAGYATAAARKALQVFGLPANEVAQHVRDHLAEIGASRNGWVADNIGVALIAAQNAGRLAVFRAAEASGRSVRFIAREENDINRCPPCTAVNGTEYASLDEALLHYPRGGTYIHCQGGNRCHGQLQIVFDD